MDPTDAATVPRANAPWVVTGNAGTSSTDNFLGTTDAQPLVVKVDGVEALRVTAGG